MQQLRRIQKCVQHQQYRQKYSSQQQIGSLVQTISHHPPPAWAPRVVPLPVLRCTISRAPPRMPGTTNDMPRRAPDVLRALPVPLPTGDFTLAGAVNEGMLDDDTWVDAAGVLEGP